MLGLSYTTFRRATRDNPPGDGPLCITQLQQHGRFLVETARLGALLQARDTGEAAIIFVCEHRGQR